ncbi:MAG: SDR family oxidoreductase [Xanthomonadales bacterium]|nr:SDR family oxidoreductase [Xanthomonadales bacterium]
MTHTAFVTGGSGFVGMNLLRLLCEQGWRVRALVRTTSPMEDIQDLDVEFVEGDITDGDSLRSAIPPGTDAVFHVAASTSIWSRHNDLQRAINVEGTRNVVNASLEAGVGRFIHTSSFIVWGFLDGVLDEKRARSDNADWINYVRTKHEAEGIVRDAVAHRGLDAVILNPAHILGPGDRHNWSRVIRMVHLRRLPGVPPGGGAFADVREVARAHLAAFGDGRSGHNYILGGPDTRFIEVVRIVGELLDRKVPKRPTPALLLHAVARFQALRAALTGKEPDLTPEGAAMITRHLECSSAKAQAELGYRFTDIRELLRETCRWMRRRGLLN